MFHISNTVLFLLTLVSFSFAEGNTPTAEEIRKAAAEGRLSELTGFDDISSSNEENSSQATKTAKPKKRAVKKQHFQRIMQRTKIKNEDPRRFEATYSEEAKKDSAGAFVSLSLGGASSDFTITTNGVSAENDKNTLEGTLEGGFKTHHKSIGQLELSLAYTHIQFDEDEALLTGIPGSVANHYVPEGIHRIEPKVTYRSTSDLPIHWLFSLGARKHIVAGENKNNVAGAKLYQEDVMGVIGTGFDIYTDSPFSILLAGDFGKGSDDQMYSAGITVSYKTEWGPLVTFAGEYTNYETDYTEPVTNIDTDIEMESLSFQLGFRIDF